ncbi:MAG: tetratricopeptide repeat protein [Leptothrix sp. (in: b-proteobacteria)]
MPLSVRWSTLWVCVLLSAPLAVRADEPLPPVVAPAAAAVTEAHHPAEPVETKTDSPSVSVPVLSNESLSAVSGSNSEAAAAQSAPLPLADPRPAAEHGDAAAQYLLGQTLEGQQHPEEARMWYERAAAQDHAAAIHQLAQLYGKGEGGPQDEHKGFELSLRAAELGWPEAMWDVANSYGAGRVAPRDLLAACTWILRTREHAGTDKPKLAEQATQVLPYLERALSLEQVAACRKQASVWPPSAAAALPARARTTTVAALTPNRRQLGKKRGARVQVSKATSRSRVAASKRRVAVARR